MIRRVHLVGPAPGGFARDGGVERYHRFLAEAWHDRLAEDGVAFALKARLGGEVVRTGDGVSAAWVRWCGRSRARWARHIRAERAAIRAARRVIAISPMVVAELHEYYGRTDGVELLLNPVFAPAAAPEPRAAGAVVFVGHDFRRKGLDLWLTAVSRLGLGGHVVGRGRARPTPGVEFHGPVEAAPWIAGAALVVHPARYEPYGNVVAEAVAAGTPVVASDGTGASCLLDPAHVWARASGADGLVAVVRRALDDPRPPRARPPTREAHLSRLSAILTGSDITNDHASSTPPVELGGGG